MSFICANFDFLILSRTILVFFYCKPVLLLFLRSILTKNANFLDRIYSFCLVFKLHISCTFPKRFVFFVYFFSLKFFMLLFLVDSNNNLARIVDVFNGIIGNLFFKRLISGTKIFPKLMRSIESMQDFILTNHFEQDISKFFLWHFKFRFTRENRKYANAV